MIEGLKFEVKSAELVAHIGERQKYHTDKTNWYDSQIESLRNGGVRPEAGVSNDPINSLERSRESHKMKAQLFTFMKEHIVPGEVYRLNEGDLARLEILDRYF